MTFPNVKNFEIRRWALGENLPVLNFFGVRKVAQNQDTGSPSLSFERTIQNTHHHIGHIKRVHFSFPKKIAESSRDKDSWSVFPYSAERPLQTPCVRGVWKTWGKLEKKQNWNSLVFLLRCRLLSDATWWNRSFFVDPILQTFNTIPLILLRIRINWCTYFNVPYKTLLLEDTGIWEGFTMQVVRIVSSPEHSDMFRMRMRLTKPRSWRGRVKNRARPSAPESDWTETGIVAKDERLSMFSSERVIPFWYSTTLVVVSAVRWPCLEVVSACFRRQRWRRLWLAGRECWRGTQFFRVSAGVVVQC